MYSSFPADPELALWILLVVGGCWWCKEILERFPDDQAVVKSSLDHTRRAVIVFFWVLTLPIVLLMLWGAWGLVVRVVNDAKLLSHP